MNNNRIENIVSLVFSTRRILHEQKDFGSEKTDCSFLHIVTLIYIKEHKPLMKDIADFLGIAPPSATSLVNNLAKGGLVKRQTELKDRRIVRIILTKKGEQYWLSHKEKHLNKLRMKLERLTIQEQDQFIKILEKIIK
jgi:DNA-binding MarR family transcriptional regulator